MDKGTSDPNPVDERGRISRRRLLALLGVAGAAAVAAPLAPSVLNRSTGTASGEAGKKAGGVLRQWAMVIDLRKCEGCVTQDKPPACTEACNTEHFVPAGQEWIRVISAKSEAGHTYYRPRPCMQCENPPCVKVCPVGATYRTEEGVILINHNRCVGCRMCMAACPYGARSFNWDKPDNPPGATFAKYSPEYPVPHRQGTVEKCMLCAHRTADGKLPACAEKCPMKAIYLGDLTEDVATNGTDVVKLSTFLGENSAYRLKEELGTRPRVWYIPGHGQEYGHHVGDERVPQTPRSWQQLQASGEKPAEHAHEGGK